MRTSLMGVKDQTPEYRVLIRCTDCSKLARVRILRTETEAKKVEATPYRCGLCVDKRKTAA